MYLRYGILGCIAYQVPILEVLRTLFILRQNVDSSWWEAKANREGVLVVSGVCALTTRR
jgi:hypothetical protein